MLILKVLNGPLFGAEVTLPQNDCLIRVVDLHQPMADTDIEHTLDQWAKDTVLTIPSTGSHFNIILKRIAGTPARNSTDEPVDKADVKAGEYRLLAEVYCPHAGMTTHDVALNIPISLGALRVAIRHAADAWSDAVLRDGQPASNIETAAATPAVPSAPCSQLPLALASLAGIACLALLFWLAWPAAAPAATLSKQLSGLPCRVAIGSDDVIYVIVQNAAAIPVIERALGHEQGSNIAVLTEEEETEHIHRWLDSHHLSYFTVDLRNPGRPVLIMKGSVPPTFSASDTKRKFLSNIPYSKDVEFRWRTAEEARREARNLVEEVGAQAIFRTTPRHFVVKISDYLSDAQLDTLSRALASYRQQWGAGYVKFMVHQQDPSHADAIKTGALGYELHPSRHVYFTSATPRTAS